jgi:hypothetical protein
MWATHTLARPNGGGLSPSVVGWRDTSVMLIFGGIPELLLQRVFVPDAADASRQSVLSGFRRSRSPFHHC